MVAFGEEVKSTQVRSETSTHAATPSSATHARKEVLDALSSSDAAKSQTSSGTTTSVRLTSRHEEKTAGNANRETTNLKNPWGLSVHNPQRAEDVKSYHQVVTLKVPSGQIVDLHQMAASVGKVDSSCIRVCPGAVAARDVGGNKLWRQPDPKNPGFDIITVATLPDRQIQTRCGLKEAKAFSGVMKFTNPCTNESYSINVNNGASNDYLNAARTAQVAAKASPSVTTQSTPTKTKADRPEVVPRGEHPSPSDLPPQGSTLEEYYASFQLPPENFVARTDKGATIKLNEGETLTLFNNNFSAASFNPSDYVTKEKLAAGEAVNIGQFATIRRAENSLPGEFILEPGQAHSDEIYSARITRPAAKQGEYFQTIAKSHLFIGDARGTSSAARPETKPHSVEQAKKHELPPETTPLKLPLQGTVVTPTNSVSFSLSNREPQTLYVQGPNNGQVDLLRASDKGSEFVLGSAFSQVIITRKDGNNFTLRAGENAQEGTYKLMVKPTSDPQKIIQSTTIEVRRQKPAESDKTPPPSNPPRSQERTLEPSDPSRARQNSRFVSTDTKTLPSGDDKLTKGVQAGTNVPVEFYQYDESGNRIPHSKRTFTFEKNTSKMTVSGIGKVERVPGKDGKDLLVFTPENNSKFNF